MTATPANAAPYEYCPCGRWALVTRPIPLPGGGEVPPSFMSDGYSCPDVAWPLVRPIRDDSDPHFGVFGLLGIKHDWRYYSKSLPRLAADLELYKGMRAEIAIIYPKMCAARAKAEARALKAFATLCAFGWLHYGKRRVNGCDDPCGAFPACSTRQAMVKLGEVRHA